MLGIDSVQSGDYDTDLSNVYQMTTNKLIEAINSDFYDLIIVDYSIVDGNKTRTTENIKVSLSNLDKCLTQVYNQVIGKNGILYISSCYGINEVLYNHKEELVNVNFSKKVPFVVVDNELSRDNNMLNGGNLSDLGVTVLNSLGIPLLDGMSGKNLIIHSTGNSKKKKKKSKLLLILVIFIILIAALVFGLYYMGLI